MPIAEATLLFAGAFAIGLVHGAEPGHGWPVAAAYALNRERTWTNGLAASILIGLGHLVSSLAVVGAYFLAISYFDLARIDEPMQVAGLQVGSPVGILAGVLLVALGIREYRHGHAGGHGRGDGGRHGDGHGDGHAHDDSHAHDDGHAHAHDYDLHGHHGGSHDRGNGGGWWRRVKRHLPFVGGHSHGWGEMDLDTDRAGLTGIVWTAFVLGFAHEEEFEIIALCTGSPGNCLALMLVYALAVVLALVGLTMALVAGYERYEERAERYARHLPTLSAVVLVAMGVGFAFGVL